VLPDARPSSDRFDAQARVSDLGRKLEGYSQQLVGPGSASAPWLGRRIRHTRILSARYVPLTTATSGVQDEPAIGTLRADKQKGRSLT
jgi:hypothetical protein